MAFAFCRLMIMLPQLPPAAVGRPFLSTPSARATAARLLAVPSRKFENFQTMSVVCTKCRRPLFRYKKKNGLKSNLVKCYVERITEDPHSILTTQEGATELQCPNCGSTFARPALIHGRPALKMAGGKVRMTK